MFLNTPLNASVLFLDHEESGSPCSLAMLIGFPIFQPGSVSLGNAHQNAEPKIHLVPLFLSLLFHKEEKRN